MFRLSGGLIFALLFVEYTTGNPTPTTGSQPQGGNEAVIRQMRPGILPFPQAVDDLQLFPYGPYLIVTGSTFISVEPDNSCWRCHFSEDFNHCVQLNQTLCNETVANGECPVEVARLDCTLIDGNSAAGPIYVKIKPFKSTRPACYVTKGSLRLQPVFDSQIYFLQPTLESCTFTITKDIPPEYRQTPRKTATPKV